MNTSTRIFNFIATIFLFTICFCSNIFAGTITQVKNGKVLIDLKGTPAQVGEHFFALNQDNKKTAIIEITAVKTEKAVGKITKGATKVSDTILSKGMGPAPVSSNPVAESQRTSFIRHDLKKLALNFMMSSDLISTAQQDNGNPFPTKETVDMKGNNIGVSIALNVPLSPTFSMQGFAGYEMLKVSSTAVNLVCNGKTSRDCNVDISYLTLGGLARLKYISGSFELWAGAGAGFKQPLSKSSTALTLENVSLANAVIVALGVDHHISNSLYVPVSFEYHKSFNESETVPKIQHMAIQLGVGILF
jgi:hypothetical protein